MCNLSRILTDGAQNQCLHATVTGWELPPLHSRYLHDACTAQEVGAGSVFVIFYRFFLLAGAWGGYFFLPTLFQVWVEVALFPISSPTSGGDTTRRWKKTLVFFVADNSWILGKFTSVVRIAALINLIPHSAHWPGQLILPKLSMWSTTPNASVMSPSSFWAITPNVGCLPT